MLIGIINIGTSNINSILKVVRSLGYDAVEIEPHADLSQFDKIVFPGVGNFSYTSKKLLERNLFSPLRSYCVSGKCYLGICLGMQLLGEEGHEGGVIEGLGVIQGKVKIISPKLKHERIPHNGWNEVAFKAISDPLFEGIPDNSDFFFNHSYAIQTDKTNILATTPYCDEIITVIRYKNSWGVQFHPEKSQRFGIKLLSNFCKFSD